MDVWKEKINQTAFWSDKKPKHEPQQLFIMKKITLNSTRLFLAAFSLFCCLGSLSLYAQTPGGNPAYPADHPINQEFSGIIEMQSDNYIMGYSGFESTNALVLNGVPVYNINSGWYNETGTHSFGNKNYACGTLAGGYIYRNFFAFDLSQLSGLGITLPITTASLRVRQFEGVPSTEVPWYLSGVSSSHQSIDQNYPGGSPAGIEIFNDLGSGPLYGSYLVDRSLPENTFITVPLNSVAISDINQAAGSVFVIGGLIDEIPQEQEPEAIPLSYWALGLAFLLAVFFILFRRISPAKA